MSRESIITDVQVDMIEYLLEHVVTMRPRFGHVSDSSHSREISYSDVVSALGNVLKNELSANAQRLIKIYLHKMPHDQEMHDYIFDLKCSYEKMRIYLIYFFNIYYKIFLKSFFIMVHAS